MMTLKIGAAAYELTVRTDLGPQRFDLSHMTKVQLAGVREMVVNFWCRNNGKKELYS